MGDIAWLARESQDRGTLTELTYETIRQGILDGRLTPGTRLKDSELAELMGVSNTPVREALTRLEASGLVKTEPRRGTFVRTLKTKEVIELYEVRETLEVLAARRASENGDEELLKQIRGVAELHCRAVAQQQVDKYLELDRRFHLLTAKAADNGTLQSILDGLADQIHCVRRMDLRSTVEETSGEEHLEIAHAMLRGEVETAGELMREHIALHKARVLEVLSAQEESPSTADNDPAESEAGSPARAWSRDGSGRGGPTESGGGALG